MKQKNASPTKAQVASIRKKGLSALLWTVVKGRRHFLVIRNRISGEVRVIEK